MIQGRQIFHSGNKIENKIKFLWKDQEYVGWTNQGSKQEGETLTGSDGSETLWQTMLQTFTSHSVLTRGQ
jgi:hypothetical protein